MPEVFISYRQVNDHERERVLKFGRRLRSVGVSVILDQLYLEDNPGGPNEGWDKWSSDRALQTDLVIIIGSSAWFQCFDKSQPPGTGLGAACEADDIRHRVYKANGIVDSIRVVLFDESDASSISAKLERYHRFIADRDFDAIVRWISGTNTNGTASPVAEPVAAPFSNEWISDMCRGIKGAIGRFLTGLFSGLSTAAASRTMAVVVPTLTLIYFLVLAYGSDWEFLRLNRETANKGMIGCLGLNLACYLLMTFSKSKANKSAEALRSLDHYIEMIGTIVRSKVDRFRAKIVACARNTNKFKLITHPSDQIAVISRAAAVFVKKSFAIGESHFDIVIFEKPVGTAKWTTMFKHQQSWTHDSAESIMSKNSVARRVDETGEPIFIADKFHSNTYFLSGRDKRQKKGSVYCFPVQVDTALGKHRYVITICTYKKQLCAEWDRPGLESTEAFMLEICRRIELELFLHTLLNLTDEQTTRNV